MRRARPRTPTSTSRPPRRHPMPRSPAGRGSSAPSASCSSFLSPRPLRGRTGLDAADILLRTGGNARPCGLERGFAAGERVRLRGGEALIEGRAAARVRLHAGRRGRLLLRRAHHHGRREHRLCRGAARIAGIAASLDARAVLVDASTRRHLVGGLAARQVCLERGLRIRLARVDAARRPARDACIRALTERRTAVAQRPPEIPEDGPATPEARDLRSVDADLPPPRPERELVPTPVLRRLQLELAREEIGARPAAVAALLQLEPARVDAFVIAFETRSERVRERAGRARQALRSCVPRRLQAWVAALVGRRGWRSDGCRRAQNGDEEREDRPLCVHTPLMGSLRHIIVMHRRLALSSPAPVRSEADPYVQILANFKRSSVANRYASRAPRRQPNAPASIENDVCRCVSPKNGRGGKLRPAYGDHGIMPHSNILLATGAAILLMNAVRICGSSCIICMRFLSSSGFGLPLRSHSCSQDACRYLWMTRSAIMSMSGYCWAAATPAKNSAGTRANGLLIMLFSFLE